MQMLTSSVKLRGLDLIVSLHTADDPSPDEWDVYFGVLMSIKKQNRGEVSTIRNFVVSDGGAPNAKQRTKMAKELFEGRPNKLAVLTNSLSNPIKRGIVTAITWLNPAFLAVSPEKWQEALRHIDLEGQITSIMAELDLLQQQLPPVKSLALLAADVARTRTGERARP